VNEVWLSTTAKERAKIILE